MQTHRNHKLQFIIGGLLIGACLLAFLARRGAAPAQAGHTLNGTAAVEQLKQDGSYASLAAAVEAARYQVNQQDGAWQAANPAQRFNARFSVAEVRISNFKLETAAQWQAGVTLAGIGRGDTLTPVGAGEIHAQGERVELRKGAVTEWYVNQPAGLEQGFTLNSPISNLQSLAPLRLKLQLSGDLRAKANGDQAVSLQDKQGRAVLGYDHLAAWDANHKPLPATMKADGQTITLEVDDSNAVYPVTIDPLFAQTQKLTAVDGLASDSFGRSMALSGNTAIIGVLASGAAVNHGAYVFVRSGGVWSFQAKLTVADGTSTDRFGYAVALDGDTAAVGAHGANNGNGNLAQGAVYVFTRSGVNWSLQQKFFANDAEPLAEFGSALALGGNTLLVGANRADSNGAVDLGAAYVFTRSGATWTQQQKLTAGDGATNDLFGYSVSLSGETALIGAYFKNNQRGAAYVFVRQAGLWSQQQKLTANDATDNDRLGFTVALSGDTAALSADGCDIGVNSGQGAVYVFTRTGTTWSQQQKITASDGAASHFLGDAVALSGDVLVAGADFYRPGSVAQQGAVYVFTRSGATWTQQTSLHALDKANDNRFGNALAVSGNTVLVGTPFADIGANANQGAVYSFEVVATPLAQAQKLSIANGAASAEFGYSVAVHNDTAVVGVPGDTTGKGAVAVYVRNGATWSLQQTLTAADGVSGDNFGVAVAVHFDTLLVGARFKAGGQGAAYVFTRNGTVWTQQQKLLAADGAASDHFGQAVALHENTALIGAPDHTVGVNGTQGSAYVFTRSGATWSQQPKLTANDGTAADRFGAAVALYGNTAIIGAPDDTPGGMAQRGSAYLFTNAGAAWTQGPKLTAADGGIGHRFGDSVALDNYTALVGAFGNGGGAAYVYAGQTGTWTLQQELFAADGATNNQFGRAVALFGDLAVLGAPLADLAANGNEGAAYLFERQGTAWSQRQKFTASDAGADDQFGFAVAIAGPEVLVGAHLDNIAQSNQGSAYYFRYTLCPGLTLTPASLPTGDFNVSYTQQLAGSVGGGPYDFEVSSGVLPRGLSLSNDGLLFGTATQAGTFNFTVTARQGNLCSGSRSYTLTININCPQLTINPNSLTPGFINQAYSQALTISNGNAPYIFTLFGALPNGLTLNPLTGLISGTPTVAGVFQPQVGVVDFNGCEGLKAFTLNINCPTIIVNPSSLPAGTVGVGGYNQPLSATGGLAPYTFSLNPGSVLPPGLSLAGDALIGGPSQGGTFNFTIKATDAQGCSGLRPYTFTANCQALTVFPATLPAMTVGTAFSQGLSAAGSDGPYTYAVAGGALPNGLTLSSGGLLSGTPAASGSGSFTVNAADVYGCVTPKQYNFTVGCPALTINPPALPNGATGVAYSQQITASGGSGNYTYSLPIGTLPPPGLTLSPSGLLSGTPTQAGQFNLTVNVASNGCTGQQSYTLTVTQSCGTLTITPATLPNPALGVAYNQQLSQSGGVGNITYSISAGNLSAGLSLSPSGLISGTPAVNGGVGFTVKATDANGCMGQQAYQFTVSCPTITISPATLPNGTTGTAYNQQLTSSGGVGTVTFGVTVGSLPTGLNLSTAGLISGTPTQAGAANFTVTAADVNGCLNTRQYTLTINAGCPAINVSPNPPSPAFVGVPYQHTFNATGGTAPYTYSLAQGPLPDGLTLSTAGVLAGTPTGNNGVGFAFTVKATDANGCMGQVQFGLTLGTCPTITVNPANLPTGTTGVAYSQQLTASGGVAPYSFSVTNGALPTGLTLSAAGLLSGTPTQTSGVNLTIKATDANGCAGTKQYLLTVNCAAITVNPATLPAGTLGAAYSQTLTQTGGTGNISYSVHNGALPAGLSLSSAGALTGTPTVSGQFNFTVIAFDVALCSGTRSYTLTINGNCPTLTVNPATLPNGQMGAAYNQTLTATGGAAPYSYAVTGGALPNNLNLSSAGTLTGTPTASGNFNVTVTATDANGCTGQRVYLLTIDAAACPSITVNPATLPNGTASVAYTQNLTASGGAAPYSYTLQLGSLPPGFNLTVAGVLSGTTNANGVFNFTVKATDANNCTGTRAYTLTIGCAGITVNPATLPVAVAGVVFNQAITQIGGAGTIAWGISAGALPAGWALNASTGQLGGLALISGAYNFTVKATDANGCFGTRAYALTLRPKAKGDFDGDGKTDLAYWNGATGNWVVSNSGNGQTQTTQWGAGYSPYFDVIVPGDYDGDGKTDHAIWRGQDSLWYVKKSSDGLPQVLLWGANYAPYFDVPTPGDFDGDGKTDMAVWRPTDGNFYVKRSSNNTNLMVTWGQQGDLPVAADYDGDGKTDCAVWRPGTGEWLIQKSSGGTQTIQWGAGYAPYFDVPVVADYDGDGKADPAIWRGQDSLWYIKKSSDGQPLTQLWGANYAPYFDVPTPGDYDGDGKADIAVWRPTDGVWYVKRSSNNTNFVQTHGQNGDTPVPAHGVK